MANLNDTTFKGTTLVEGRLKNPSSRWYPVTLANGWVPYSNPETGGYHQARYRFVNGAIQFEGLIKSGTSSTMGHILPEHVHLLKHGATAACFSSSTGYRLRLSENGVLTAWGTYSSSWSSIECFMGISTDPSVLDDNPNELTDATISGNLFVGGTLTHDGWRYIGDGDEPAYLNGWVAGTEFGPTFEPLRYKRIGPIVYVNGMCRSGTTGSSNPITVLPHGYRPISGRLIFSGVCHGDKTCRIDVKAKGEISVVALDTGGSNSWVYVDIAFPVSDFDQNRF